MLGLRRLGCLGSLGSFLSRRWLGGFRLGGFRLGGFFLHLGRSGFGGGRLRRFGCSRLGCSRLGFFAGCFFADCGFQVDISWQLEGAARLSFFVFGFDFVFGQFGDFGITEPLQISQQEFEGGGVAASESWFGRVFERVAVFTGFVHGDHFGLRGVAVSLLDEIVDQDRVGVDGGFLIQFEKVFPVIQGRLQRHLAGSDRRTSGAEEQRGEQLLAEHVIELDLSHPAFGAASQQGQDFALAEFFVGILRQPHFDHGVVEFEALFFGGGGKLQGSD